MKTLREIKIGETVKVVKLHGEGPVKRRIMDMGITKGIPIFVRKVAPLGDPVEIIGLAEKSLTSTCTGVEMFRNPQVNIPLAGIVENMAWFTPEELPENRYYLFGKGGARRFAEENGIDLLGEIPIIQSIMEGADTGTPSVSIDARVEPYYREIADRIVDKVVK